MLVLFKYGPLNGKLFCVQNCTSYSVALHPSLPMSFKKVKKLELIPPPKILRYVLDRANRLDYLFREYVIFVPEQMVRQDGKKVDHRMN